MSPMFLFLACVWLAVAAGMCTAAGLLWLAWICLGPREIPDAGWDLDL